MSANPFSVQNCIIAGDSIPTYLFGSLDWHSSPTKMFVTSTEGNGTDATLGVIIKAGNIPVVGQSVSVRATTGTSGAFNGNYMYITAVSGFDTEDNSIGTISYANTATQSTTTDVGEALAPQAEVAVPLVEGNSQPFCVQSNGPNMQNGRTMKATVIMPSLPTSVVVSLCDAISITDTFEIVSTIASVTAGVLTGGSVEVELTYGHWYCISVGEVTGGTNPSIIAKIIC